MPNHATANDRLWLLASLMAGLSYCFAKDSLTPEPWLTAWKGSGVALLAAYAYAQRASGNSRQIAAVMAFGAMGDVLIELTLEAGAAAFLVGHLIAIHLYLRNLRPRITYAQMAAAAFLLITISLVSFLLPAERAIAPGVALYAAGLAGMTASACCSSFVRYRVGIGSLLFAVSDLLIFARMGPLATSPLTDFLIWPLYYGGQVLICTGVVGHLRRRAG